MLCRLQALLEAGPHRGLVDPLQQFVQQEEFGAEHIAQEEYAGDYTASESTTQDVYNLEDYPREEYPREVYPMDAEASASSMTPGPKPAGSTHAWFLHEVLQGVTSEEVEAVQVGSGSVAAEADTTDYYVVAPDLGPQQSFGGSMGGALGFVQAVEGAALQLLGSAAARTHEAVAAVAVQQQLMMTELMQQMDTSEQQLPRAPCPHKLAMMAAAAGRSSPRAVLLMNGVPIAYHAYPEDVAEGPAADAYPYPQDEVEAEVALIDSLLAVLASEQPRWAGAEREASLLEMYENEHEYAFEGDLESLEEAQEQVLADAAGLLMLLVLSVVVGTAFVHSWLSLRGAMAAAEAQRAVLLELEAPLLADAEQSEPAAVLVPKGIKMGQPVQEFVNVLHSKH